MPLIVEDGSGLADAESLCSVEEATAYHAARGNIEWAGVTTIAERERALRRATAYIEHRFSGLFRGSRTTSAQALSWPRIAVPKRGGDFGFWPDDEVPVAVRNATAELALRSLSTDLLPDAGPQVTGEALGPMSVQYAQGGRQTLRFTAIEAMLSEFMTGGGASTIKLGRA